MIRRLIAITALAIAGLVLGAGPAGADHGDIACIYSKELVRLGLCVGMP